MYKKFHRERKCRSPLGEWRGRHQTVGGKNGNQPPCHIGKSKNLSRQGPFKVGIVGAGALKLGFCLFGDRYRPKERKG